MATRIRISDALYEKYHFAIEYAASCGYTFIDEFKAIDFIAMRSYFDLTSIEVQEMKNYLKDCQNGLISVAASNIASQQNNSKRISLKSGDTEVFLNGYNSTTLERNITEIKITDIKVQDEQQPNGIKGTSTSENIVPVTKTILNKATSKLFTVTKKPVTVDTLEVNPADSFKQSVNDKCLSLDGNIGELELSARAIHALSRAKIKTINQLLSLTEEQLYRIRNIGKKTVAEILATISVLKEMELAKSPALSHNQSQIRDEVRACIEDIIFNNAESNNYKSICKSAEERELVEHICEATEILGSELALATYTQPEKIQPIITEFREFIRKTDRAYIINRFKKIPEFRLKNQLEGYLKAFRMDNVKSVLTLFNCSQAKQIIENDTYDISFAVEDLIVLIQGSNLNEASVNFLNILLNHLKYDLSSDLRDIISNLKNEKPREYDILVRRGSGETLESIAKDMGLTRERIRQMEARSIRRIAKLLYAGKAPLMLISADRNGDSILTQEEIVEYFNDELLANVFIDMAKLKDITDKYFVYDKELDVFRYRGNNVATKVDFTDLPDLIFEDELTDSLKQLAQNKSLSIEEVEIRFAKSSFRKKGRVYHRGRLTNEVVYGYVLKHFYPSGIKLYDGNETQHFREKVLDVFDDIELPDGNRAIDAAVAKIAILYDRGMYIHPSYVQIQDDMIDEIDSYLQYIDRTAISFNELFEKFKAKLQLKSNIHNRYFLQGVLKNRLASKYYFSRDYISKEQQFSIGDDIEAFIKKNGRVHKSQIFEKFAGITEIVLAMKTGANNKVISLDNGEFMHSDLLDITEDDYKIESYIASQITEYPISCRKLLEDMWLLYPDFMMRNNINTHSELFGVLRFMFDEKFKFSRPFIAKIDAGEISNLTVLKQHLEDYDTLVIEDLMDICEENHIRVLSWRNTIRDLNSDFLRIDAHTLSRFEEEMFDDETIQEIYSSIIDDISSKGYVVGHKFSDFIMYPEIGFTWNAFLLRSIVEKYLSEQIAMIEMPTTDTYAMGTIFVSSDCEAENYVQLLKSILKSEHNREPFQSINEAIDWLKQEGLFLGEPPKCLTDGQIISVDEYGSILI